jgi:phenylalanyl-tRNA synthetase alpha chain
MSTAVLSTEELARDLALRDLADPAAGPHAIQLIAERAVGALQARWHCPVRWCRGPRIVPVADNYDRLGYRRDDVTRAARYSRYVDANRMLRSHATAMVPPALRALAAEAPVPDVLLACPGVVYRRDAIDRLHTGTPHQLDLWRVTRGGPPMTAQDLREMIGQVLSAVLPGARCRLPGRRHPYTTGGVQVDVRGGADWVEIGEAGLAAAGVLRGAGLRDASGLALGVGLDRLLMLAKGIPDIRLLRSPDPRVTAQLLDLAPYRAVSARPAIRRDLSVAVDAADLAEDLGDRVRGALGEDAACVEEVQILSRAPAAGLPAAARARLGATPGQHNLLVRVVLRDLDRTLTGPEANLLRDRIYAAIHQGSAHQWSMRP